MSFKNTFFNLKLLLYYLKYQVVTKAILALVILPVYYLVLNFLLKSSGRINISSGDFLAFFFSFQGLGLLIITLILLVFLIALDINIFIVLSALIHQKKSFLSLKIL